MLFWWCILKSALCIFPAFLSCARLRTARQTEHRAKQNWRKPAAWDIFFNVICKFLPAKVHCYPGKWLKLPGLALSFIHGLTTCVPASLTIVCWPWAVIYKILISYHLFPRMSSLPFQWKWFKCKVRTKNSKGTISCVYISCHTTFY